ncbi:sulfite exporter TauE/SafE family protein [Microbacterium sp. MYb62]|uniref:sulfite exporter TauE/SafE family protein n=1 Tax=Microbacterium sp. MYb62 TaxID=1848690 RepID=UPI000CFC32AF|nr:sulfite exporter TauE/SafE family protein [Microbacterium sp. MYb62]PRB14167.1 permease [Microbacterium sp. MYb62]
MSPDQFLLLFVAALAAGALGSALGMAGGIFIVPILTLFAGAPFPVAVAVSLLSVIACSCASASPFLAAGLTNLRLAVVLEVATALGALVGILMIGMFPPRILFAIFAAVLVASAIQMLLGRRPPPPLPSAGADRRLRLASSYTEHGGTTVAYRVSRVPLGLSFMFGAGLLSALLGIGSGVLKIPAMDAAMRLPLKVSSATANLTIGVTACGAAAAYLLAGNVDLTLTTPIVLGSLAGAVIGARALVRMAGPGLRIAFVVVLLGLAIPMTSSAFGLTDLGGVS